MLGNEGVAAAGAVEAREENLQSSSSDKLVEEMSNMAIKANSNINTNNDAKKERSTSKSSKAKLSQVKQPIIPPESRCLYLNL